ncbi:hypothetical protein [Clostridium oryzae]|uniref:Intracellular exo-alpha-(1->5)-L-arabinofuranosidase n=1 Tax=Clostridium oryzae TaxID=1450648 RepID=A0A1V4IHT2_9CLOT|nr:hypothetical protein [Clostridium oryzae]OPJ59513.1 intracellular exo-alpha-(1->5)-L-arabinofuranosidase [Clostridium oryzae]
MKRAKLKVDKDFTIAQADEQGFCKDMLKLMRELNTSLIRYPGGFCL